MGTPTKMTVQHLRKAIESNSAAFRLTLKLEAVSPKVFPPTYEKGKYATEDRMIGGTKYPCVLLDSTPSQANRMELALQDALDEGVIQIPVVSVDFSGVDNLGIQKITSFQAPHRIVDAILRDSTYTEDKKTLRFRDSSIGKELNLLGSGYATPLLNYAPHCLVFGMWDSTGPRGGMGVKFSRSIVSEIIGVNAVDGVKTSSRIDPLNIKIEAGPIYCALDGGWTVDEALAIKDNKKPVKFKNKEEGDLEKEGRPSLINHGNIKPVILKGGFTIEYAEQTTVLSLPALRRLRFPAKSGEKSTPLGDLAARTYLAAIGLLGATLAVDAGYDLRSRCILRATNAVTWDLLGKPGDLDTPFVLDRASAIQIYKDALAGLGVANLPIHLDEIILKPEAKLVSLVKKSMEITSNESEKDA